MPTDCDPCPGKTKANGFMQVSSSLWAPRQAASEVQQDCAPGETAAHAFEHDSVSLPDLAAAHRDIERQRNRGRRSVAVLVDRDHQLVRGQLQLARGALHD